MVTVLTRYLKRERERGGQRLEEGLHKEGKCEWNGVGKLKFERGCWLKKHI